MLLKSLTNGPVVGGGTLDLKSLKAGGVLITTDNTNAGTVVIRMDGPSGKIVFQVSTVSSAFFGLPLYLEGSEVLYYNISGTNCSAQLYEWID